MDKTHPIIYIFFLTDQRNTPKSRHIGMLTVTAPQVKKIVEKEIAAGRVVYSHDSSTPPIQTQLRNFRKDWYLTPSKKDLNNNLRGCFLDTALSGYRYTPPEERKNKKEKN